MKYYKGFDLLLNLIQHLCVGSGNRRTGMMSGRRSGEKQATNAHGAEQEAQQSGPFAQSVALICEV